MATGTDSFTLSNAAASSAPFPLKGGNYVFTVIGTGFGSVSLEILGPDGSTYTIVSNIAGTAATRTTNGNICGLILPAGTYKIAVTTATAVYANVAGVLG